MRPGQVHFRDPVHGSTVFDRDELAVIESRAYQRLRGIKQLGFTDHAFPGATHSRFVHSLGTAHLAGRMIDAIFPADQSSPLPAADRRRFRAMVRLAGLLHDIGHAPLSHATESCMPFREALALGYLDDADKKKQAKHEDYTALLILNSELATTIHERFASYGIEPDDIVHLITGRCNHRRAQFVVNGIDYAPLLSQLVSGELDADRMDYLQRDSFYAGVNYGKFDEQWLLNNLTHHVEEDRAYLAMSHRAIFAFEDFLLSRYHMFVSVYYHHTAIGFDTMLSRFIEDEPTALVLPTTADAYLQCDDVTFWSVLRESNNQWARRIADRDIYRIILELNAQESTADLRAIGDALDAGGIDHFVSRDEGVLSRYYGGSESTSPIYVINAALGRATRVGEYSKLFERYAQPARLTRIYCRPDQSAAARERLRTCLTNLEWEQLRLEI